MRGAWPIVVLLVACEPRVGRVLEVSEGDAEVSDGAVVACDCFACEAGVCDPIAALAPGHEAACVVLQSGRRICWGRPGLGLFGDGVSGRVALAPRAVDEPALAALALGPSSACGLSLAMRDAEASVSCWGDNYYSQLGTRSPRLGSLAPLRVELGDVDAAAIVAGEPGSFCVVGGGAARCWGMVLAGGEDVESDFSVSTTPTPIVGLPESDLRVGLGAFFGCGWSAREVACFGSNERGQLGLGKEVSGSAEGRAVAQVEGATGVAVGATHACALRDGVLSCWGELAADDVAWTPRVVADGVDAAELVAGRHFTCAVVGVTRTLRCWGAIDAPPIDDVRRVAAAYEMVLVETAEGVFQIDAGRVGPLEAVRYVSRREPACEVGDRFVALGEAHPDSACLRCGAAGFESCAWGCHDGQCRVVKALSAGEANACALGDDGALFCWGDARAFAVVAGDALGVLAPTRLEGLPPLVAVALGAQHGCGRDATGQTHCWGDGPRPSWRGVRVIASGGDWTCALDGDGAVCSSESLTYRVADVPAEMAYLSVSASSACAAPMAARSEEIRCWQHGPNPTLMALPNGYTNAIGGLAAADDHYAWELTGTNVISWSSPSDMSGGQFGWHYNLVAFGAGRAQACAIESTGRLTCWGSQEHGALGPMASTDSAAPIEVQGRTTALAVGARHVCALADTGDVRCWGDNRAGQLGSGRAGSDWNPNPRLVTAPQP